MRVRGIAMLKRIYLLPPFLILFILLALWPVSTPTPYLEHHDSYTLVEYSFSRIDDVKISNGVIVRSGGKAYLIGNGSIQGYRVGNEKILGSVGNYLVTYLNYKVHVKRPKGFILNDKWSKSLKLRNSVAVGEDFIVMAEHDYKDLKVNVFFYFPENGETKEYSFKSDRKGTVPKVAAKGKYAIIGVPYTWRLYYFKEGKLLWEGSLPVECGYEDYPHFSLHVEENGTGYAISSEGKALAYFNEGGFRSMGINEGYCLQFSGEEENVTTINAAVVFDNCFAALVWYKGLEDALYFYNMSSAYHIENFTFKAETPLKLVTSSEYLLAHYENYTSIFDCNGEVLRIDEHYDEGYPFGDDFLLVRYGGETTLHLPLTNRTYRLDGVKIVGTAGGKIIGVRGNQLITLILKE